MRLYRLLERTKFRAIASRIYRVTVIGADRIPATGPVVLVANHESLFDPWLLALATPRPIRYMAKSELWRYRIVGAAMDSFGAFPVERGAGDAMAISHAAALLHAGEVLGMFPQGTSKRRPERPFHRGAARLALATGAPLVPIALVGTRGVPWPWKRRCTLIRVGEPILSAAARPTVAVAKALTTEVETRILDEQAR